MPRRKQPPRLYLRPARRNKHGKLRASAVWIILDGGKHIATGCVKGEDRAAQQALSAYITAKYKPARKERDIEAVDVADVLSIYDDDTRDRQVNKAKFDERLRRLNDFWGGRMLSEVTGETCRAYVSTRGNDGGARRDLEDLRAAINHHAAEGFHRGVVCTVRPRRTLVADAVRVEPVSIPKFPANREKNREFHQIGPLCKILKAATRANSKACSEIPYAPEQGIVSEEQGILA